MGRVRRTHSKWSEKGTKEKGNEEEGKKSLCFPGCFEFYDVTSISESTGFCMVHHSCSFSLACNAANCQLEALNL